MPPSRHKLLLIDAHALIHRCYHALPPLTNNKGEPVGALYGVASLLIKIIRQQSDITHIAALFDRPEPTFRKQKYDDYKIHRAKTEDDLALQLVKAIELFRAFNVPVFELPGYEGDDLIGTLARRFEEQEGNVTLILTGDMDSLQLVRDDHVYVQTFRKGISDSVTYDEAAVRERYGLEPKQLVDYKALVGDASDNIPGVPGIGAKTATAILQKYETLDRFMKEGSEERAHARVVEHRDLAILSRELATIDCAAPITVSFENLAFSFDVERATAFLDEQNFASLSRRLLGDDKKVPTLAKEKPRAKSEEKERSLPKDMLIITSDSDNALLSSAKPKVGYDIKDAFKTSQIAPPYYDIKIACDMLEVKTKTWEETSDSLFKKVLPYEEFLLRGYVWARSNLASRGATRVYEEVELPLIPVLARMENIGVGIDRGKAQEVERSIQKEMGAAEEVVREHVPREINLNSPKQLLEFINKTWDVRIKSTGAEVLEKFADKIPPAKNILAYRELFKLQSTYVHAIQKLAADDGRIHPTFVQIGAATGRIACQNPNLQNIPQESSWSKDIRNIFVPQKGFAFVSVDYSQIELRVLASLSGDQNMIKAFRNNEDIHALTASKIFNVPQGQVTKQMRRAAKTLNFGMVYGMGSRALAQASGLSQAEAKTFIQKYFSEFSSVKKWQEEILAQVRRDGFVKNKNGRVRMLPEIHSVNKFFASSAEREAINMPTQGLAADILKLAMIHIDQYVFGNKLQEKVHMVLTIHDELVFEIEKSLLRQGKESAIVKEIQKIMENAHTLDVPLKADVSIGERWGEMM